MDGYPSQHYRYRLLAARLTIAARPVGGTLSTAALATYVPLMIRSKTRRRGATRPSWLFSGFRGGLLSATRKRFDGILSLTILFLPRFRLARGPLATPASITVMGHQEARLTIAARPVSGSISTAALATYVSLTIQSRFEDGALPSLHGYLADFEAGCFPQLASGSMEFCL